MLSINERYRLADLESLLLRTDRQFVVRMEHIAEVLLPLRGGPPPLDDVIARSGRTRIDERRRVGPSASPITRRYAGMISRLGRSWMEILAVVWAGFLVGLGIGATTTAGTVMCMTVAAIVLALVGHRWIGRLARSIVTLPLRLAAACHRSRRDAPWQQGAV